jgi:DNA-binding LacI/PurR family transcriptional regulator
MARDTVTLADVARLAGVSQSAVSRSFTDGASVSEKTRARVLEAATELGYRPNRMARAMITGKSRMIGLVVAYLENQFYPLAIELLSRKLQEQGYHILLLMAENSEAGTEEVVRNLLDYGVDGIITASVSISNDLTARCESAGIPIVMFNRSQDDPRLSAVTSDNLSGGRMAANFLVAGGHRKIAHISGWQGSSTGRDRAKGFVEALGDQGLQPFAVEDGMYDIAHLRDVTRAMFGGVEQPDAVFVGNDHMAIAAMDVLRFELGLRVPEDVSVIGYDDVPQASWPTYDLTTISQPVDRMVEETVEAVLGRVNGNEDIAHRQISGELIIRGSARKPEVFCP